MRDPLDQPKAHASVGKQSEDVAQHFRAGRADIKHCFRIAAIQFEMTSSLDVYNENKCAHKKHPAREKQRDPGKVGDGQQQYQSQRESDER